MNKTDLENYMRQAIKVAGQSKQAGGAAIGSVLVDVKTGEIAASGQSLVSVTHDPTDHAEMGCIRQACRQLANQDLSHFILFSTLEPCVMCLGACVWAGIGQIYFGAGREDVGPEWFESNLDARLLAAKMYLVNGQKPQVQGEILKHECAALLEH